MINGSGTVAGAGHAAIRLGWSSVLEAGLLVLLVAAVSWHYELAFENKVFYGTARMTSQLILVGVLLVWIFGLPWYGVLAYIMFATALAAREAFARPKLSYGRLMAIHCASVFIGVVFTLTTVSVVVLGAKPWCKHLVSRYFCG